MAIEVDATPLPALGGDDYRNFDDSEHARAFYALMEQSKNLADEDIVGRIIKFPVADGYAYYLVKSEDPLQVSHIDFMDAWRADPILIRGLEAEDVRSMVRGENALRRLFAEADREQVKGDGVPPEDTGVTA